MLSSIPPIPIAIAAPIKIGTAKTPRIIVSMQYARTRSQKPAYATCDTGTYTGCAGIPYPAGTTPAEFWVASGTGAPAGASAGGTAAICAPHWLQNGALSAKLLPHLEQYTSTP